MPGKRVSFDAATWSALDLLARDRTMDFQALADEAFRDLLQKYGRPTELQAALRRSAKAGAKRAATTSASAGRRTAAAKRKRARRA